MYYRRIASMDGATITELDCNVHILYEYNLCRNLAVCLPVLVQKGPDYMKKIELSSSV